MSLSPSTKFLIAAVAASTLAGATSSRAGEIVDYASLPTTTRTFQGGMVSGVTYKTAISSPITLNSLGFIDIRDNPAGNNYNNYYHHPLLPDTLNGNYQIGIWKNSTQELLGVTVVTPASTLIGNFRYSPIYSPIDGSPISVTLPGNTDFTIAALLPADMPDAWLYTTASINLMEDIPPYSLRITGPGNGRIISGATSLAFPTGTGFGTATSIVNASESIVPAVTVPEPATLGVLATACATLLLRRRIR